MGEISPYSFLAGSFLTDSQELTDTHSQKKEGAKKHSYIIAGVENTPFFKLFNTWRIDISIRKPSVVLLTESQG